MGIAWPSWSSSGLHLLSRGQGRSRGIFNMLKKPKAKHREWIRDKSRTVPGCTRLTDHETVHFFLGEGAWRGVRDLAGDSRGPICSAAAVRPSAPQSSMQPWINRALLVRKGGRTFTHPWRPTRLNGCNSVCPSSARHSIKAGNDVPADHGLVPGPHKLLVRMRHLPSVKSHG